MKELTVSSHVYAQFLTARIPLFASDVILKSCVTQCESWIAITLTLSFLLIWLETLCAYTHEDTVMDVGKTKISYSVVLTSAFCLAFYLRNLQHQKTPVQPCFLAKTSTTVHH